jgi:hypothetical protein
MGSVGSATTMGMAVSSRQPVLPGASPGASFVGEPPREALPDEQSSEGFRQGRGFGRDRVR